MHTVTQLLFGAVACGLLGNAARADEAGLTCEFSTERVTLCGVDKCHGRSGIVLVPPIEQLGAGRSSFDLLIPARKKGRMVQAAFITSDINKMLERGYFRVEIKPGARPGQMRLFAIAADRNAGPYELAICVLYSRS